MCFCKGTVLPFVFVGMQECNLSLPFDAGVLSNYMDYIETKNKMIELGSKVHATMKLPSPLGNL